MAKYLNRNTRLLVPLLALMMIAYTKSLASIICTVGGIFTALLAKILKRVIKQKRPSGIVKKSSLLDEYMESQGYGMPSSHSMTLSYFAHYVSIKYGYYGLPIYVFLLYTMISRVHYGLHTIPQVLVGFVLGLLSAILWTQIN